MDKDDSASSKEVYDVTVGITTCLAAVRYQATSPVAVLGCRSLTLAGVLVLGEQPEHFSMKWRSDRVVK